MTRPDPARARAEAIWAEVELGIPQPRPSDWPADEAVSAAAERAEVNGHCSACREATS